MAAHALSVILGVGVADAADLPARTGTPRPAAAYNWTGCYLGAYVGGAWQSRDVNAWDPVSAGGAFPAGTFYHPNANNADSGNFNYNLGGSPTGGGTLGCNWQGAWPLVFGIEGEGGYMKVAAASIVPYSYPTGADAVSLTRIGDWNATLAGRLGVSWDHLLVYLKGGVGFADIHASITDACATGPCSPSLLTASGNSRQPFWVAGGGVEYALNKDWSIKGEALVLGMYKTFSVCGAGAGAAAGSTFCGRYNVEGVHSLKLGVNYHFNSSILAKD